MVAMDDGTDEILKRRLNKINAVEDLFSALELLCFSVTECIPPEVYMELEEAKRNRLNTALNIAQRTLNYARHGCFKGEKK